MCSTMTVRGQADQILDPWHDAWRVRGQASTWANSCSDLECYVEKETSFLSDVHALPAWYAQRSAACRANVCYLNRVIGVAAPPCSILNQLSESVCHLSLVFKTWREMTSGSQVHREAHRLCLDAMDMVGPLVGVTVL